MNSKHLVSTLLIVAVFNFSNGQNESQFERNVFYKVVPEIIDSQFPNPKGFFILKKQGDSTSVLVRETSVNAIIGIVDSVYDFNHLFYNKYINLHFPDKTVKFDKQNNGNSYKIDVSKIEKRNDYNYKHLSEIPPPDNRWKKSKDFYLIGLIGFSRIQFDEKKGLGIMDFVLNCGEQCGVTALVYLKNNNGNWEVDEIESIMIE